MCALDRVNHERAHQVMRWSFGRYVSAGAVATAVHYAVLAGLVEMAHADPGIGAAFGAVCGAVMAYLINARYTFVRHRSHRYSLPRFLLVAMTSAAANGLLVTAGTAALHWHYSAVQVIATLLLVMITYQCNRRWSFA